MGRYQKVWYSINEWGKVVGKANVYDSSYYDVTDCYELYLDCFEGNKGTGIYLSKPDIREYPDSLKGIPSNSEVVKLEKFIKKVKSPLDPKDYFRSNSDSLSTYHFLKIIHNKTNTFKYAVVDGREFILVFMDNANNWKLAYLTRKAYNYSLVSIVDIDNDKIPEMIFQESYYFSWQDLILKKYPNTQKWKVVA